MSSLRFAFTVIIFSRWRSQGTSALRTCYTYLLVDFIFFSFPFYIWVLCKTTSIENFFKCSLRLFITHCHCNQNEVQSLQAPSGMRDDLNKFPKNWKYLGGTQRVSCLPNPFFPLWSADKTINDSSRIWQKSCFPCTALGYQTKCRSGGKQQEQPRGFDSIMPLLSDSYRAPSKYAS